MKPIANTGDLIIWTFDNTPEISEKFRGKSFSAKVAIIDFKEKHYGVYAEYGQDLIDFESATIICKGK